MITRLAGQGLVRRAASDTDGRLARVHLTEEGRNRIEDIDTAWKRLEKEALAGLDDKDRKRLRRLLREIERNLSATPVDDEADDDLEDEPNSACRPSTRNACASPVSGSCASHSPASRASMHRPNGLARSTCQSCR
jgi:hypothetical protein